MNTDAKRYYAVLGLDPRCSDEDIRSAFRRRAKQLHPDSVSGDATAFIRLKRAYDTLSDPASRAHYDRASNARVRRAMHAAFDPPLPPRVRVSRPGGMSFARYFVAFLFMGGLSFGAIEALISNYADEPPTGSSHLLSLLARETAKDDSPSVARAATTAASGFWDPSSPDGTPRETHKSATGIGSLTSE